jgi:hypothetical protein
MDNAQHASVNTHATPSRTDPAQDFAVSTLRWIAMPFAAFGGAFLGAAAVHLLGWLVMRFMGGFREDGWFAIYVYPAFSYAAFGWLYTMITLKVSPSGKFVAGVVMITIYGVLIAGALAFIALAGTMPKGELVHMTICSVITMVVAISTLREQG